MLINLLSQLGIIVTILASLTQQVEILQQKVEDFSQVEVLQQKVEKMVEESEVIEEVLEEKVEELDVSETFKCRYDSEICDCEVMVKGQAIAFRRVNCEYCPRFEMDELKTYYNPAIGEYFSLEKGECFNVPCQNCEELNYWGDTFIDCNYFKGGCPDSWKERKWQSLHYFECWMDKCVERGTKGYRYLSEQGNWIEADLPEDYNY